MFNTELMEVVELGFLLECADALVAAALARDESRGGHYREDHPLRDDANWLKHSLAYREDDGSVRLEHKPVKLGRTSRWSGSTEWRLLDRTVSVEILEDSDLGGRRAPQGHAHAQDPPLQPEVRGEESWWDEFEIQADPDDRLLDALHQVKWYHDGTLALRRSCAHGICGSDAMMIDGKNALACKVIVRDIAPKVTVEPIRGLPVLKDLIVDMEPFFAGYRSVLPYLINDSGEPDTERLQSPEDRQRFDDTTKCILCAACTTSCPIFWGDEEYVGPAAIVNAHRFVYDSRDEGGRNA